MSDLELFLLVIGIILFLNIISLIVAIFVYPEDFNNSSFWKKSEYYTYFLFIGFTYWIKIGFENLVYYIKKIRNHE